jgi:NAD(P)-dependent dehydrogenase (short-subunit alcohol dehydrogenase family)
VKTALVTGSNRGLGLGFVQSLSARGYQVFATCRHSSPELEALASDTVIIVPMDVENDESIASAYVAVRERTRQLDLLINSAGVNSRTIAQDTELSRSLAHLNRGVLLAMFNINAVSPAMVIKQFVPILDAADGIVANVSTERASFSGSAATSNYGYAASKVALNMITKELRPDLEPLGVRAFCVHPGRVRTAMGPFGDLEPVDAANLVLDIAENLRPDQTWQFLDNKGALFPL